MSGASTLIDSFAPTITGTCISGLAVPVPEPATLTLLGSALLTLGALRFLRWRRGET